MKLLKYTLLLAGFTIAGFTAVVAQNANDIIEKHVAAMGGSANWDKIKSIKMVGSMSVQGMEIGFTETIVDKKAMRNDINAMGQAGYSIITTTEGWMYLPFTGADKVTPMPAEQVKMAQEQLNIKTGKFIDKSKIDKAEYLGRDTVNKIGCFKLKITEKDGNVKTNFIDASTYYLVRMEAKMMIKDQEQEMTFNFSDFKKQPEGITIPMTVSSPLGGDVNFKSVEINKPVDESIFKPSADAGKK